MVRHYTAGWSEQLQLGELKVGMRLIRPEDKGLLVEGFEHMSFESRRLRFMGARSCLSEKDLSLFTDVDQEDHIAIGAQDLDTLRPMGTARCIRAPGTTRAEAAVTIVDEYQHHGLGTLLLRRVAEAARERGITTLRFVMSSDNGCMRHLAERLGGIGRTRMEQGSVTLDIELGVPPAARKAG